MKTRDEIIAECVGALRACYNYYADEVLSEYAADHVLEMLDRVVPQTISTEGWQKVADDYRARVENGE